VTSFKVLFLAVLCGFFSPISQAEESQDKALEKSTEVINLLARTYHSHNRDMLRDRLGLQIVCDWDTISRYVDEAYDENSMGNNMAASASFNLVAQRTAFCGLAGKLGIASIAHKVGNLLSNSAELEYMAFDNDWRGSNRVKAKQAITLMSMNKTNIKAINHLKSLLKQ